MSDAPRAEVRCPHEGCGVAIELALDGEPVRCLRCGRSLRALAGPDGEAAAWPSWAEEYELGTLGAERVVLCSRLRCRAAMIVAPAEAKAPAPRVDAEPVVEAEVCFDAAEVDPMAMTMDVAKVLEDGPPVVAELISALPDVEVDGDSTTLEAVSVARARLAGVSRCSDDCAEQLLRCPRPGCDAVVGRDATVCAACGERYSVCSEGGQVVTNRALARWCRGCGVELRPRPRCKAPAAFGSPAWEARVELSGWLRLAGPFDPAHRRLVRGARLAGGSAFALPSGELISCVAGIAASGPPRAALTRLFPAEAFASRSELLSAPLAQASLTVGAVRRQLLLATTLRRVVGVAAETPDRCYDLLELERQLGQGWQAVGGAVAAGDRVLIVARRVGQPGLLLLAAKLGGGAAGAPELELTDRSELPSRRKLFLGPTLAWGGRAALISADELVLIDFTSGRLATQSLPLFGAGGLARFDAPERLFGQGHALLAGNPTFTGERLLLVTDGEAGGSAVLELIERDGSFNLRKVDPGVPETEIGLLAREADGRPQLIEIWGRRLHAHGLLGNRRTLDYEPFHDQQGGASLIDDVAFVRRLDLDGFECYRLRHGGAGPDLAALGRLSLPGMRAISAALPDEGGVDVLVIDADEPSRLGVARVAFRRPEDPVQ